MKKLLIGKVSLNFGLCQLPLPPPLLLLDLLHHFQITLLYYICLNFNLKEEPEIELSNYSGERIFQKNQK